MNNRKLMLIDGNSILNRAFYGLQGPKLLSTSYGLYTNAVYGFLNILNKYLFEEDKPNYICVAFDLKAATFRHIEYDGYKAKRKGMPDELAVQVPVIKDVLDAMNIKRFEIEGFEADDIIGTVSSIAEQNEFDVVIITGDRDALQLASKTTRIKIPKTKAGKTETEEYNFDKIVETYGITPKKLIDVKGLMGDTSDNIPGVPGIGEKTAFELIKQFDSIENIYENIESITKPSVKNKLVQNRELAFLSKKLGTIHRSIPNLGDIEDLRWTGVNTQKLYEIFKRLQFKSLIEKYNLANESYESSKTNDRQGNAREVKIINTVALLGEYKNQISTASEMSIHYLTDKTHGFDNHLTCLAITIPDENSSVPDDAKNVYIDLNGEISEDYFVSEFKEIFENAKIIKYGHDMKNFIRYLKIRGISLNGLGFDTMIGAYIINPAETTYTLPGLSMEYLNNEIPEIETLTGKGKNYTEVKDINVNTISLLLSEYSTVILKLKEKFEVLIKENNQEILYYDIELPLVEVLADMEYRGFKIDVEGLRSFSYELEEKIDSLTKKIYALAGEAFNISSPKQLGVILFDKLKLPVLKKTKTGYSTDAEVLEQLTKNHEIVAQILEFRQLMKLKSTYVEGLINVADKETSKIHSRFNQTVTVTGRISSTEPNLQNIPIRLEMGRNIRKVFIPTNNNFVLLDADYSQIELRVLAHITHDPNMLKAFRDNEDIHTATASSIFKIPKNEITTQIRSRAKAVNFGIVYGISDFSLAKDVGISKKEAGQYIDDYLNTYPNVKKYMHDIVEEGKQSGYVTTLFNRRRYIPELKSNNFVVRGFGERIAMNTPIQGTAADIIKIAMVSVYNELKNRNLKSRLILQVHDELIIETHKDEISQVAEILKDSMENAAKLEIPLTVDVKSGYNWYEAK